MRRNFMPLYIRDFLGDTAHLSAAQTGAYLCLIMDYWLHDGLPDDDLKLAQIARVSPKAWRTMRPTIQAFFRDGWRHKRIDAELTKMICTAQRKHEAALKAGTMSAIARERNRQNGATSRSPHVNVTSTPRSTSRQRHVNHSTQEYITTTEQGAAREADRGEPEAAPQSIATTELAAAMQRKGWVR